LIFIHKQDRFLDGELRTHRIPTVTFHFHLKLFQTSNSKLSVQNAFTPFTHSLSSNSAHPKPSKPRLLMKDLLPHDQPAKEVQDAPPFLAFQARRLRQNWGVKQRQLLLAE
jgi:hypothetical protein